MESNCRSISLVFPDFIFFLKIFFIYFTEIETASERGNTSRGSGRGRSRLIAEEPDVGLDRGLLDFSACLLWEVPAAPILSQPCLGRVSVSPARGDGDGHAVSQYFPAFVLWWLSLVVCCAYSEIQISSGQISASVTEQRDRGPFSTDVLATLTLFLLVLLNPAASWDVCPTPASQPSLPGPVCLYPLCF